MRSPACRVAICLIAFTCLLACDSERRGRESSASSDAATADDRSSIFHGSQAIEPQELVLAPLPAPPSLAWPPLARPAGALDVVASRPTGEVEADDVGAIAITFSKPVAALETAAARSAPDIARIEPDVPGEWRWLGSSSLEFVPRAPLPKATAFRVTVHAGLRAIDGSALKEAHEFAFNTQRPRLLSHKPEKGYRFAEARAPIALQFNQPVLNLERHARLIVVEDGRRRAVEVALERAVLVAEERRERERARGDRVTDAPIALNGATRYELRPRADLPLDAEVVLEIDGDLSSADGPLSIGAPIAVPFATHGAFSIEGLRACDLDEVDRGRCARGPLFLALSNPVQLDSLREKLSFDPPVEIDWEQADSDVARPWMRARSPWARIPGRFLPGTTYAVRIREGLMDVFGQRAAAFQGTVRMDDLPPQIAIAKEIAVLEKSGDGAISIEAVNAKTTQARIWRLTPAEMLQQLTHDRWSAGAKPPIGQRPIDVALDLAGQPNVRHLVPLDLRQALDPGMTHGFFLAEIDQIDDGHRPLRVIAQITDLAVHAKLGVTNGLIWVTSIGQGSPISGAALRILARTGEILWRGETDAEGLAEIPGLAFLTPGREEGAWQLPPLLIVAETGDDRGATFSQWSDGIEPWRMGIWEEWQAESPSPAGLLFTDRGVYRPGDTVYLKGLARHRRLGALEKPAAGARIAIEVVDSRDNEIFTEVRALSDFGTFEARFVLPEDAPLGVYGVRARLRLAGGESLDYGADFRVEAYRAPQFQVDVIAGDAPAVAGDPLQATVEARYLFGGAMAGADVRWSAQRSSVDFNPPMNQGFSFGARAWGWNDGPPLPSSEMAARGVGRIGADGAFHIAGGALEAPGGRAWSYDVEAEVTDVNRQRIAGRRTFTVHPAALYAGVRAARDGFAEAGRSMAFELIAVSLDGSRQSDKVLRATVRRRDWKAIQKKGVGGRWFTDSEPVEVQVFACEARSAAEPARCAFTPDRPGLHLVEVRVRDDVGREQVTRQPFYVTGAGWAAWQRDDDKTVELVADRKLYDVGDTARILVKSPWPEAEALITVERGGVLFSRQQRLEGTAAVVSIPISGDLIPNAFVGVMLVRGRLAGEGGAPAIQPGADAGRPDVRVGAVEIAVERRSKRLSVALTPDKSEYRPRDRVRVAVRVGDAQGGGQASEVTVWAVDEGILRLTDYQPPDALAAIHRAQGNAVRTADALIHLVMAELYGDKGEDAGGSGGGDAAGSGLRSRFLATPLFTTTVTDERGRAEVEFALPDNLTTYRIMAFAVTRSDLFGAAQASAMVTKPLLAMPALPRFALSGDVIEAGVVLHRRTPGEGRVTVRALAQGVKLLEGDEKTVALAQGAPREARFRFMTLGPGTAALRFEVEGAGHADAVEQKLEILLPVQREAVAVYGDTRDERLEAIVAPDSVLPGHGELSLTLASTLLGGMDAGMRQLVEYPYGCAEQLGSRLIPFIALRELHGKFAVPYGSPVRAPPDPRVAWIGEDALSTQGSRDPDVVIAKTISALEGLQRHDGSFGYWPSSQSASVPGSIYVTLALGRAAEVGYPVSPGVLDRARGFLVREIASGKFKDCAAFGCRALSDATRVFALYALARTGAPQGAYYGEFFTRRARLPVHARAMLASAIALTPAADRVMAEALLGELLNLGQETPSELQVAEGVEEDGWSSTARTSAIVLQALVALKPDHPHVAKLTRHLLSARQRDGAFRNTQEAAFALMALSEVARVREREVPDFTARVLLDGREVARAPFQGRSMKVERHSVPMAELGKGGPQTLAFRRDGEAGALSYGARLSYYPRRMPKEPLDRGMAVQRWFEPYAGGGQTRGFAAGELVRVKARVATPMARQFVAVEIPLPAGLEAVDASLASTARAQAEADPAPSFERRFYSPFEHRELRDDRALFFADFLPAGVHAVEFLARATTPGNFQLRPARAEQMYAPEVFGRSDGGAFSVEMVGETRAGR